MEGADLGPEEGKMKNVYIKKEGGLSRAVATHSAAGGLGKGGAATTQREGEGKFQVRPRKRPSEMKRRKKRSSPFNALGRGEGRLSLFLEHSPARKRITRQHASAQQEATKRKDVCHREKGGKKKMLRT